MSAATRRQRPLVGRQFGPSSGRFVGPIWPTILRVALSRGDAPCTARRAQPVGPTLTKASHSEPLRVLIIEDDAWIRSFIREVLADEGYVVIEAADGGTGLRLADQHNPDVVLLDLAMPEFTGVDVLHGLKRMARTR